MDGMTKAYRRMTEPFDNPPFRAALNAGWLVEKDSRDNGGQGKHTVTLEQLALCDHTVRPAT